ncbi:PREDICTED: glucose dehydrogenase [FAD, quinone]-like [Priapulus caudatus]|uniref:Glucose dehydrogenase [FAD, quinone]-like n=1 Tax=Priapulus caudatus TaxID=37621 RepID=A0ABM1EYS0_PRICU|nr:PREDICTED: glucose dehydrogenase [FAD, quinone]-like [Priapulus caudatus]
MDKGLVSLVVLLAAVMYMRSGQNVTYSVEDPDDVYDYIIGGGGTAGCVLANRLSADPDVKVLLVEAGGLPEGNKDIDRPASYAFLKNTKVDWRYMTVPQKFSCQACEKKQSLWSRGKVLGGSSCINAIVYARGSPEDYNKWEKMGASGWSYENVLPFFKKSENVKIPDLKNSKYHGVRGPLTITQSTYTELGNLFLDAARELGYRVGDINGASPYGGGRTAGCVLANRLSADPDVKVLLVEAGGVPEGNKDIDRPASYAFLKNTKVDWRYMTVPQKFSCQACEKKQSLWSRGKVLGGSSCINAIVYARGSPEDYNKWEKMGASRWSYENVLPYFKKSENVQIPDLKNSKYHGVGGPLTITQSTYTELGNLFLDAARQLGYRVGDINGASPYGVMKAHANIRDGTRAHTAKVYLQPVVGRPNLHVITHAHVTKDDSRMIMK